MRLDEKHMGTVSLTGDMEIMAGGFGCWKFVFTAGEYGIDDGGTMVLAWKSVSDWGVPQFDEPSAPNYTSVTTDGNCRIKATYAKFVRSFGNSIRLDITGGYIKKGDTITITLGDRSGGSIGMRAQSFVEAEHEFKVFLDPCGTFRYEEMPSSHFVRVTPGWVHEIQAVVPGSVRKGENFRFLLRALDEFGNPTGLYDGTMELGATLPVENLPRSVAFSIIDGGAKWIEGVTALEEGFLHIIPRDRERGMSGVSNPCLVNSPDSPLSLYWGDAHAQTRETVGTGKLSDYYAFARDKGGVDFTGWQGNDFEITEEAWERVRKETKAFHRDGSFVVFLGYEWSGTTPQGGDHNVYFKDDSPVFYPSSNWTATSVSNENNCNPVTELYSKAHERGDMLIIPHIGGRYMNLDYYDREHIRVIEIHSHHGTFEWFAMDAMAKHLRVGFIASSDDHTCRPGLSYPLSRFGKSASSAFDVASGFSGVFSESLTRDALWDAIKKRHCYASSFDRYYMETSVDGHMMGDEYRKSDGGDVSFSVKAAGSCPLENITLFDWDKEIQNIAFLPKSRKEVRIRWTGVMYRGRGKSALWDGTIYVEKGAIRKASTYAFDRLDQGIKTVTDKYVEFQSSTSGDWDGLVLNIEGSDETRFVFTSHQGTAVFSLGDIRKGKVEKFMGGLNLKVEAEMNPVFDAEDALSLSSRSITLSLPAGKGEHAYWARVTGTDGNSAWSSPVFVDVE